MKNEKFYDVCDWMPFKQFDDSIFLKNGVALKVLEVKPINFKLKSDAEQIAILESYKRFLKQCDFDIQIIMQSLKTDVNTHLKNIEKYSYGNDKLQGIMHGYVGLVMEIVGDKSSITRKFFLVIKVDKNIDDNIDKIIRGLGACGNEVQVCMREDLEMILKNYFCKNEIYKE